MREKTVKNFVMAGLMGALMLGMAANMPEDTAAEDNFAATAPHCVERGDKECVRRLIAKMREEQKARKAN